MAFRSSLTAKELARYVGKQLDTFFPDGSSRSSNLLIVCSERGLARIEHCIGSVRMKYFYDGSHSTFSHLHTDQYALYLCYLANALAESGESADLAAKVYALNKALHGIDVFHEVSLPNVLCFQHPLGTVLGRARYADYFLVYQRCTVGAQRGTYPTFGNGVVMYGGSAVIGKCNIGENVWISTGALVMDEDIPSNSIVSGSSPDLRIRAASRDVRSDLFGYMRS